MAPRRSIATLMAWLLLVSLAVIGIPNASEAPAAAQPGIVHLPDTSSLDVKSGELATVGTLALLAEPQPDQPRGLAAPTDSPATDALLPVEDGRICIDAVAAGDGAALLADVEALGLTSGAVVGRSVGGCLPVDAIDEAAQLPTLQSARPAISVANVGATTSQGDAAMSADVARTTHGIDGSGVTVGVLSNSYDCAGGAAADVASGDLPSGITVLDDTDCPATDEGRAMMQIIADVAPGAGQAFHTGTGSQAGFAQGILDLESAGSDVIVDDILFLAEPMFQDGIVAQAVDQVKAAGAAYFSAAGNFARRSYEQDFRGGSGQSAPFGGELHDFDPGPGIDVSQAVTLPTGTTFFSFQWNDVYASAGPGGSATDYDIYICTSAIVSGANCATSGTLNNLGGDPVEVVPVTVTGGPGTVWVALARFGSAPGRFLKYVAVGPSGFSIDEHDTQSGTIYGHANAAGAEAIGAAAYASTPAFGTSPPVREPFSSAGGTALYFDSSGNPVGPTVRQKPELVAPDGVNNTFFPQASPPDPDPEGDGFPNFGGTSAAAPHAAAAAALLLECDPNLTPDALYGVLESNAIDMEGAGFDDATGYGLVDVSAAADEACDASPGGGGDQTFAVVGDYGTGWTAEGDVASLIDSYAPDFIVTTGDNFYNNNGGDYDSNVGAFYGDYIGGAKNRFFPSPGNTDYGDPVGGIADYLDYFELPGPGTTSTNTSGSELYFDVIEGSVHFFFIDTTAIINGWSSAAAQKQWLQTQLAASTTPWQAVVLHHPPFTSRVETPYWDEQWPFAAWGADVLFAGHDHSYERFAVDGIPHFISGLGGRPPHDPAFSYPDPHSVPGTQYNSYDGAMIAGACDVGMAFEFHAWNDVLSTDELFDPFSVGVPCDGGLAPPVSPSSLSAAETGPTSIEVTWTDNAANETGFDVEVSTTGINGPWTLAGSVGAGVETYAHTDRSPDSAYCYRARATNGDGSSPPSNVGCATTASGPPPVVGSSVGFDGDDRVVVGDVAGLAGDVSFELWLRPEDVSVRRNPLAKAYSGEGTITQEVGGRLTFIHGEGGGNTSGYEWFPTSAALPTGVWSHVVVTRSGSTVSWFVNGVLDSQRVGSRTPVVSSLPLTIGDGYTNGYVGGIDEVAVYDRALTPTEVSDHYAAVGDQVAYATMVTGDSPVSYWRLDEATGPLAVDEMGTNPGSYQGTPLFGEPGAVVVAPPPVVGSSVGFDGDDRVVVGDVAGLAGDVSFELWLRPEDVSVRRNPLAKAYSGEGTITQEVGGRLTFIHGEGGGNTSGYEWFPTSAALPTGVWSHVVVTRSGSTVSWFVNGVLDSQRVGSRTPVVSSLPLTIGDGYTNGYVGGIDEVAVYDRALTPTEVSDHYAAVGDQVAYATMVTGDSPVSYWRLDEATGPLAVDEMGTNPGSYQGTPLFGEPGAVVVAPPPVVGSSVGFDGDDRVVVGDVAGLAGDVSFELWLRPEDVSVRRNPLAKAYSGEGTITQEVGGRLTFIHGEGGGNTSGYEWFPTSAALPTGVWSHVVVTRSGSTVSWFVNGVLDSQRVGSRTPVVSSLPLTIGDGYTNGYVGGIDEVAVYDRALTPTEVSDHYAAVGDQVAYATMVTGDSPVSYWRLDEATGPLAVDEMGTNPGSYQGTPLFGEPGATAVIGPEPVSVVVTEPSSGSTVSGSVALQASTTGTGVLDVQFQVDGSDVGAADGSEPYSTLWDSSAVADGGHAVTAVTRTATASATSNEVTVTIDNSPPVVTLIGENPQTIVQLDPYVELGASATDGIDGNLTASIMVDAGEVDTMTVGTYSVTYNVSDSAGNAAVEAVRTVNVIPSSGTGEVIAIPSGLHTGFTATPEDNVTYQCAPGAILDGQGSTTYAFFGSADNVSIIGCEIRNYNNPAQQGAIHGHSGAHDWLVRNNNIHDNWGIGVYISGDRPRVINNHIHHQHQLGMALPFSVDGLVEGNEINHNNWLVDFDWGWEAGGTKFWSTTNLTVRNNHSHDNHGPGFWTDNNNSGTLYEDNLIEDNCANGIMHEISFDAVIRNNTLNRNGSCHAVWFWGPGILISASSDVEVYGNTLNNNYNGITVVDQCRTDNGINYESLRNSAHDNVINNSGISGAISDCGATVELAWSNNNLTGNSVYRP